MRILAGLLLAIATVLPAAAADTQSKELSPEELGKLLEQKDKVFFLDVRPAAEIEALGSVKGYVNIPLDQLPGRLKEIPKDKLIVTL
jgi:rhodanese-related sulfurtransferase